VEVSKLLLVLPEQEDLCMGSRHLRIFIEAASLTQHRKNVNKHLLSAHTPRVCMGSSRLLRGSLINSQVENEKQLGTSSR